MSSVVIDDTHLTNIANSIREKTGTEDTYKPSEMASAISEISTGGGSVPENGFILEGWEYGHPTIVTTIGMTEIGREFFCWDGKTQYQMQYYFKKINLNEGLQTLVSSCFKNLSNLLEINLPESLISIGDSVFSGNRSMVLSHIPDGVTSIGEYAFNGCYKVNFTELPSGVTSIKNNTFTNCVALTNLTCLGNLTEINGDATYNAAFGGCSGLKTIILPNVTSTPTLGSYAFNNTPIKSGTGYIYVPDALVDSFKSATNWSTYADQIKPISEMPTE